MGRVGQPKLLLATFLIAFLSITTLIEGQTRKLVKMDAVSQDSEGIKGPSTTRNSAVDHPFDTNYYLSSGDGFQDMGIDKDGSTRINTENAIIGHGFIPGILGFPWGLGLPLPFPFPFPFPFPPLFPLPGIGLPPPPGMWGGYGPFPGGPGRFPWGPGGYPGGPGGYPGGPGRYPGGPGGPGVAQDSEGKGKGEHKD